MTATPTAHAALMDRTYRHTRHVYDLTRRYFLLGRDRLLRQLPIAPGDAVVEIGCGTARNLIRLARMHPHARLFGIDASRQMLDTAADAVRRAGLGDRITLRQGLAESLDPRTFGLDHPFDVAICSYCLSMIPPWREAIDAAVTSLRPGGTLGIVDFHDQRDLPAWFASLLTSWLRLFHVERRPQLHAHLDLLASRGGHLLQLTDICRRYAFIAMLRLSPPAR